VSATTVILATTNRILRAFRHAGAISPEKAKTLQELGCRRNLSFRKLEARGVLVSVPGDRWYLKEDAAEEFAAYRRVVFLLSLAVALVALGIVLYKNVR
jgi:hypothetical protein